MDTYWVAARWSVFNDRLIYWCKDGGRWRWTTDREKAVPYTDERGAAARAGRYGHTICVQVVEKAGGLTAKPAAEGVA